AEELTARLTVLQRRMVAMLRSRAQSARRHVEQLAGSRAIRNPQSLVYDLSHRIDDLDEQALRAIRRRIGRAKDQLSAIACRADALSPLAVLGRGYSMTTDSESGVVLHSSSGINIGRRIHTRLSSGSLISRVE